MWPTAYTCSGFVLHCALYRDFLKVLGSFSFGFRDILGSGIFILWTFLLVPSIVSIISKNFGKIPHLVLPRGQTYLIFDLLIMILFNMMSLCCHEYGQYFNQYCVGIVKVGGLLKLEKINIMMLTYYKLYFEVAKLNLLNHGLTHYTLSYHKCTLLHNAKVEKMVSQSATVQ